MLLLKQCFYCINSVNCVHSVTTKQCQQCQQYKQCQQFKQCQLCQQCKQHIARRYLHLWWYFSVCRVAAIISFHPIHPSLSLTGPIETKQGSISSFREARASFDLISCIVCLRCRPQKNKCLDFLPWPSFCSLIFNYFIQLKPNEYRQAQRNGSNL